MKEKESLRQIIVNSNCILLPAKGSEPKSWCFCAKKKLANFKEGFKTYWHPCETCSSLWSEILEEDCTSLLEWVISATSDLLPGCVTCRPSVAGKLSSGYQRTKQLNVFIKIEELGNRPEICVALSLVRRVGLTQRTTTLFLLPFRSSDLSLM